MASDRGERGVGRAVGRSVNRVYRPSVCTSLFTCDSISLLSFQRGRKEFGILKIKVIGSEGRFKIMSVHSGSFSARGTRSPNHVWQGTKLKLHLARSSVLRCLSMLS